MKIEKNLDGSGFILTNQAGESLNVSFAEFWDICRTGREIDTKSEVKDYLVECPDIGGHDLDRIRAFPALVDAITDQVIDDRIGDEYGDQIYNAAAKCINAHIAELESKVKWFALSEDKCISVWYAPDEHDGDQFQMHLEEKGEDGYMGPACEIISSDSYATNDISYSSLCETLREICDDADVYDTDLPWGNTDNIAAILADQIFDAFGLDTRENSAVAKTTLDSVIDNAQKRSETANTGAVFNVGLSKNELDLIAKSLDMLGDRVADKEGYLSGEKYWDLKDKLVLEMQKQHFKDDGSR
ncbi:MAG: hypothetical protein IJZ42_13320 [Lachnospiraceae bacterium]|nr:hypothetical protein [Lachnospiraceae bacterium]